MVDYKYKDLYNKPHIDKQMKIIACDYVGYGTPDSKYPAKLEHEEKFYLDAGTNYYYKCRKEGLSYSWKKVEHEYELIVFKNSEIDWENFELSESLCSESELRFGCCEASVLKFRIHNTFVSLKEKWLTVTEVLDGNTDVPFQFGRYKVFSDVPTADRLYRDVTAYDAMYDIINSSAINWYNSILPNKDSIVTMRQFRSSFIENYGLKEKDIVFPNDSMAIKKTIQVGDGTEIENETEQVSIIKESSLSGKDVITAICEINGCFGHIGRDGKFHYIYLKQDIMGLYPSNALFPDHAPWYLKQSETGHLYPQEPKSERIGNGTYINANYEDYICRKINKVQVREKENDIGAQWPEEKIENENSYIVEDNFLVYGKTKNQLKNIARNIYEKTKDIIYRPFSSECTGNPCLEVGDAVRLSTRYELIESYILKRTLKGIQLLRDNYSSEGEERYSEKVNSVSQSIIQLKGKTNTLVRNVEETRLEMKDVEEGLSNTIAATAESLDVEIKNTKQGLESKINVNTRSIKAEVNRAINEEGKLSGRLELEAERITAEVTRATQEEGKLSGKLEIEAGHIEAEVSRATSAEGKLSGRISIAEQNIDLKVNKGSVSSEISIEPDAVEIKSNRLIVESEQFKLDRNGNAEFGGNLKAATGTFFGTITSDNGTYYAKITNASMQGGRSGEDVTGYVSFNSEYRNTGVSGTRLSGKGIVAIYTPYLGVGDWTKFEDEGLVYVGQTDSTTVVTGLEFDENGIVKSYSTKTISFQKGLMTTVLN